MFEHLTPAARGAVVDAQVAARAAGRGEIAAEHLLLALAGGEHRAGRVLRGLGLTPQALRAEVGQTVDDEAALRALGVDLAEVRRRAEEAFGAGALSDTPPRRARLLRRRGTGGHLALGRSTREALEQAVRRSQAQRAGELGVEHLLLGLLEDGDGAGVRAVRRLGVEPQAVRERLREDRAA